jgi:ABC-type multidrug transport system fused ATPase/permease subunit
MKTLNYIGKDSLKKIVGLLNTDQKKKIFFLVALVLLSSGIELLGLGLIIPAIGILVEPNYLNQFSKFDLISSFFNFPSQEKIIIVGIVLIVLVYMLKGFFLSYSIFWQNKFVTDFHLYISKKLFSKYLNQIYVFHLDNNSSDLIRNINIEAQSLYSSLLAIMTLFMELVLMLSITILLIQMEPLGTILIIIFASLVGICFSKFSKSIIFKWGQEKVFHQGKSIQSVMEGLGGIKMVKVLGREKEFEERFLAHFEKYTKYERLNSIVQQIPRVWIEFLAILSLCFLIISIIYQGKDYSSILPIIALFTGAAFRLIPSASKVFHSIQTLRFNETSVNIIYNDIVNSNKSDIESNSKISEKETFNLNKIILNNVTYRYGRLGLPVIKDLSFEIKKGESIGIIGETGSGKSTLVNILLGLLKPQKGKILIDNLDISKNSSDLRKWQKNIGYVPQDIFLMDDTIENNIVFGLNKKLLDHKALGNALKNSQLKKFIGTLPDGIKTMVGERGVRLSGGQIQRIGIARALYHNPSFLIFDEATSSLDYDTEDAIVDCIDQLEGKTKIIIAHRLSSVKNCDYIIKLNKGKIDKIVKPQELIK